MGDQPRQRKCARETNGHSEQYKLHSLPDNQPQHILDLRSERDPNADLRDALGHGVRGHAVDAQRRQQQRGEGEGAEERKRETALVERGEDLRERAEIDWRVAIERSGDVAQRRDQRFRLSLRADYYGEAVGLARTLQIMDINSRLDLLVQ